MLCQLALACLVTQDTCFQELRGSFDPMDEAYGHATSVDGETLAVGEWLHQMSPPFGCAMINGARIWVYERDPVTGIWGPVFDHVTPTTIHVPFPASEVRLRGDLLVTTWYVYRRSASGAWALEEADVFPVDLELDTDGTRIFAGDHRGLVLRPVRILERTPAGWVVTSQALDPTPNGMSLDDYGLNPTWASGRLAVGDDGDGEVFVLREEPTGFVVELALAATPGEAAIFDFDGSTLVLADGADLRFLRRGGPLGQDWRPWCTLTVPDGWPIAALVLRGDDLFFTQRNGLLRHYTLAASGQAWEPVFAFPFSSWSMYHFCQFPNYRNLDVDDETVVVGDPAFANQQGRTIVIDRRCDPLGEPYCDGGSGNPDWFVGARLHLEGSHRVADDELRLVAHRLPAGTPGFFMASTLPASMAVVGVGTLCVGGAITRFDRPGEVLVSDANGHFELHPVLNDFPGPTGTVAVQAGETWHFQAWVRDSGPAGSSRLTNAMRVTFAP